MAQKLTCWIQEAESWAPPAQCPPASAPVDLRGGLKASSQGEGPWLVRLNHSARRHKPSLVAIIRWPRRSFTTIRIASFP